MLNHFSLTGLSPSPAGFPKTILLSSSDQLCSPNPMVHAPWFGLFRVRSPLLTESIVSFSSSGYLDVSVHRVPLHTLWIGVWIHEVFSCGFPHSEISGSLDICSSPKLIAAYHVFHRLLVPRHPPCALSCLASSDTIALISDGLLFLGFSTCSLLSQRLVSSLSLRLTYFRCFVYAVFKVHI